MKVPMEWLKEYVDGPLPLDALQTALVRVGIEVEGVAELGKGLAGVRVVQVEEVESHPDSDRLRIATVWDGQERARVVTGAANIRSGLRTVWAPPGATLPDGRRLETVLLRGVPSPGMLLAADEMGIGPEEEGILELGEDAPLGADVNEWLGLPETVLELGLTPNMAAHCQSLWGVAREVAAAMGLPLRLPEAETGKTGREPLRADIADAEGCPRYDVALFSLSVADAPSPFWLKRRLWAVGSRSHGAVVDVTNYLLYETGQPLHAFDAERVDGPLQVRRAAPGERARTLDGEERDLTAEDLVIADGQGVAALAGVMGGERTRVTTATRRILLESAHFDPRRVGRTSRRLHLMTEAAARFEKGTDIEAVPGVLQRALALWTGMGLGEGLGSVDVYPSPRPPRQMVLGVDRINDLLGTSLDAEEATALLRRVGFGIARNGPEELEIRVPSWRTDIKEPVHLIGEAARLFGPDRLPARLPRGPLTAGKKAGMPAVVARFREAALAMGLDEVVTFSLVGAADLTPFGLEEGAVAIANPLREEESRLRPLLLPGLLKVAAYNQARRRERMGIHETGRVFGGSAAAVNEETHAAVLLTGPMAPENWSGKADAADFFDLKGILEGILRHLTLPVEVVPLQVPYLHPGRQASLWVAGREVFRFGELHPQVARAFELSGRIQVAEGNLSALPEPDPMSRYTSRVPRFPAVVRDLSLVLASDISYARLEEVLVTAGGTLLESVRLFDTFAGAGVGEGRHSLAFHLTFRLPDRTLTDREVEDVLQRIRQAARDMLSAELRS